MYSSASDATTHANGPSNASGTGSMPIDHRNHDVEVLLHTVYPIVAQFLCK
jgi:hypothetical protein